MDMVETRLGLLDHADLELTVYPKLPSNLESPHLSLPSTGIAHLNYHMIYDLCQKLNLLEVQSQFCEKISFKQE